MNELNYLQDIVSGSVVKIKESLFIKKYLPLLFYRDPYVFNITWITEVSQSPHARVYIVEDLNENTILFSIPPLRADLLKSKDPNILNSLNLIKARMNMSGLEGQLLLEKNLPNLIGVGESEVMEFESEWKAILDRYNLSDRYVKTNDEIINTEINLFGEDDEW